jgi:hypothetical protein
MLMETPEDSQQPLTPPAYGLEIRRHSFFRSRNPSSHTQLPALAV